jgi:hypothetical protein
MKTLNFRKFILDKNTAWLEFSDIFKFGGFNIGIRIFRRKTLIKLLLRELKHLST